MATIITKNSSTASSVPAAGSLQQGELAVNVTDKKLYTKDSSAAVVKLVGSLGNQEANAVAITGGTINGTAIGGTTPAAAAFTTASASGGFTGNLTGNASTVTNGVYITGSYADPAWITSLAGSKITGNISGNAANVTGTVAIANGGTGLTALGTGVQTALGQTVTGSGGIVLAASPSLTTPNLGTPSAVTLTNATGLPVSTGISGLGTNVATALGVSVGSVGSVVVNGGALGTPSSGTLTNATGLPLSTGVTGTLAVANGGTGITAFGSGVATALGVNVGSAGAFVVNGGALGTPSSGTVTNLTGTASININGTVGATTPNTGSFTTLTTSSTVTINGGTANGVAYLNGSKVLTTGSALTFDGSAFQTSLGTGLVTNTKQLVLNNFSGEGVGITFSRPTDSTEVNAIGTASSSWELGLFGREGIVFATGGGSTYSATTEQMRLTSTGLGIGTSSPATKLDVNGDVTQRNGAGVIVGNIQNSSGWYDFKASNNTLGAQISTAAALPIRFLPNGTEQMTLNASGNLGLGVTPSAWISSGKAIDIAGFGSVAQTSSGSLASTFNAYQNSAGNWIYKTTNAAAQYQCGLAGLGQHAWFTAASGTAGNAISFTQAMDLANSSGASTLTVNSAINTASAVRLTTNGGLTAGMFLAAPTADHSLGFQTAGSERARITSGGNLLVGTTDNSTGNIFVINGSMAFNNGDIIPQINYYSSASTIEYVNRNSGGAKTFSWYYGSSGSGSPATLSTSGVWTNASDARGKENVSDVNYGLATVSALKPRQYDVKSDGSHRIGFVAQELAEHVPEVVHVTMTDKEGSDWYGVDYGSITAVLVKAIQELKAEFDAYKASHP